MGIEDAAHDAANKGGTVFVFAQQQQKIAQGLRQVAMHHPSLLPSPPLSLLCLFVDPTQTKRWHCVRLEVVHRGRGPSLPLRAGRIPCCCIKQRRYFHRPLLTTICSKLLPASSNLTIRPGVTIRVEVI